MRAALSGKCFGYRASRQIRRQPPFRLLHDAGNAVARTYGLVFELPDELVPIYTELRIVLPERNGYDGWELPIPGTFVIAPSGRVELAYVEPNHYRRLEPQAILDALDRLRAGQAQG